MNFARANKYYQYVLAYIGAVNMLLNVHWLLRKL